MNLLENALDLHEAGLKVIPVWPDDPFPFPPDYSKYREAQSTDDLKNLFTARDAAPTRMALLCTGGIEAIDIDTKHDPEAKVWKDWFEEVKFHEFGPELLEKCVVQKTKSGGWHLIYRTHVHQGNTKLARAGGKEAVIETRGKGGILFIAPSPGYKVKQGDLKKIPMITNEEREWLWGRARHLDLPPPDQVQPARKELTLSNDGLTPWDDFNQKNKVLDLALDAGWRELGTRGNYTRLNRPGAKNTRGTDATVLLDLNVFYPFTSSSEFDPNKGYTPFAFYTTLNHGGDFKAATRAARSEGYGGDIMPLPVASKKTPVPDGIVELALKEKFDFHSPPPRNAAILFSTATGHRKKVAGLGQIGVLTGHEKSGKSFVLSCMAAAWLGRTSVLDFDFVVSEKDKMLWFDMEQSDVFWHQTQSRIHMMAGVHTNVSHYEAYHLRQFSPAERLAQVIGIVEKTDGVAVVVIDGFVDIVKDYNSLEESKEIVDTLMRVTKEKDVLLLGVLHVNKGDGKIRGHLGSELKNKSDFVFNVKRVENDYTIYNPTSRYPELKSIDFTRNEATGFVDTVNAEPVLNPGDEFEEAPF